MPTVWLTYSWEDNKSKDVDFVAQEIERSGLTVKLDRWNIQAGLPLWEQIDNHITNQEMCDAWVIYATQNSLGSEKCREEYRYALDRALNSRGVQFPVIALFPSTVDTGLMPAGIRTRLYVSLTDPDWKERIKAAAEGRAPSVTREEITAYEMRIYPFGEAENRRYVFELRPRAGTWSPFVVKVPITEKEKLMPQIAHGPRGRVPSTVVLHGFREGTSDDRTWWIMQADNEVSPSQSCFLFCKEPPAKMIFGIRNGLCYEVSLDTQGIKHLPAIT